MNDPLKLEDYNPDQEIQEQMEVMWQEQETQEILDSYTGEADVDLSDYDGS